MQKIITTVLLVSIGLCAGLLLKPAHAQRGPSGKIKENTIGSVPKEYGQFKGMSGIVNQLQLAYENDKGELFLFEFRGGKLNDRVSKITRD